MKRIIAELMVGLALDDDDAYFAFIARFSVFIMHEMKKKEVKGGKSNLKIHLWW